MYYHYMQELSQSVFDFAKNMLSLHGSFLCKLWQGPETKGNHSSHVIQSDPNFL